MKNTDYFFLDAYYFLQNQMMALTEDELFELLYDSHIFKTNNKVLVTPGSIPFFEFLKEHRSDLYEKYKLLFT